MPSLGDLIVRIGADASGFDGVMSGISSSLKSTAVDMATLTAPIAAIGAAAFLAGNTFDEAGDKIRAKTGETGAALQGLEASFKTVFTSVPVSAEAASTAIAELHQRTGESGTALEDLATKVLLLAKYTGTDLAVAIPALTRVFADWGIGTDAQGTSLDFLYRTTEKTGVSLGSLSEKVVQFGSPMRALGFSFDEAATLLAKFEKEGVNIETAMPGLRIGLQNLAKQGVESASEALKILIERIKEAPNPMAAAALAAETFGKRAGTDLSQAIREGRFDIDALLTSVKGGKDTLLGAAEDVNSFGEKFQLLKNNVTAALEPLGKVLVDAISDLIVKLKPATDGLGSISEAFRKLDPDTRTATLVLGAFLVSVAPISLAISSLTSAIGSAAAALPVMAAALTISTAALLGWVAVITVGITAIVKLGLEIASYRSAVDDLAAAQARHGSEISKMETMLRQQGVDIADLSKQYGEGRVSQDEYRKSLSDLLIQVGKTGRELADAGKSVNFTASAATQAGIALNEAFKALNIKSATSAKEELDKLKGAYDTVVKAVKDGRASIKDQENAWKAYATAAGLATTETEKMGKSSLQFSVAMLDQEVKLHNVRQEVALARAGYALWLLNFPKYVADTLAFTEELNKQGAALFDVSNVKLPEIITQSAAYSTATGDLNTALGELSIKSTTAYAEIANSAAIAYGVIAGSSISTDFEKNSAMVKMLEAQITAAKAAGQEVPAEQAKMLEDLKNKTDLKLPEIKSSWDGFGKDVSTIMTNTVQSMAKILWEGTGSFGEKFKGMFVSIAEAATAKMLAPIASAIANFITNTIGDLLGGKGFGGVKKSIEDIGDSIGKIFGGGSSAASAAGTAAGGAGQAGGAAGSAGGVGGAAAGGLAGWIGAIGSAVSAISGVIGIFQNAKQETTLNAIEESTRYTKIYIGEGSNSIYAEMERVRIASQAIQNDLAYVRTFTSGILDNIKWVLNKLYAWDANLMDIPGILREIAAGAVMKSLLTVAQSCDSTLSAIKANTAATASGQNGIESVLRSIAGSVRTPSNISISVTGSDSPRDTGDAIVRAIRGQGVFA